MWRCHPGLPVWAGTSCAHRLPPYFLCPLSSSAWLGLVSAGENPFAKGRSSQCGLCGREQRRLGEALTQPTGNREREDSQDGDSDRMGPRRPWRR